MKKAALLTDCPKTKKNELGKISSYAGQEFHLKVSISIYNESLVRLERMIEIGMREGTLMQLNNLEELLAKLSSAKETKQ